MPIYDYSCLKCDKNYEVIKSIKEYNGKDPCPTCGNVGDRRFSCRIEFIGAKVEDAEFNVGLGKITKGKRHREELAKQMGVVEVGNEKTDSIHKHFDKARDEKRQKAWDDL